MTYANEKQLVHGDKLKIGQVIYNLIDNAIKFSNDNSNIYITITEKGEKVHISIRDVGCGIPKENYLKYGTDFINRIHQEVVIKKGLD